MIRMEELKIDILKQEIELVYHKINHFDDLRHRTKQMAITLWLAATGVGISSQSESVLFLAMFVPIPFWIFESVYHKYQEGYSARLKAIENFIQTGIFIIGDEKITLEKCIDTRDFGAFPIPDYYAKNTISKEEHKKRTSLYRNFIKVKMLIFYVPLVIIALVLALHFSNWFFLK